MYLTILQRNCLFNFSPTIVERPGVVNMLSNVADEQHQFHFSNTWMLSVSFQKVKWIYSLLVKYVLNKLSTVKETTLVFFFLRQVKAWVERIKRPPTENAKILFMTLKDPSKGFHKDMIRHNYLTKIVLENSSQASRDIPWTMTSQNLFSQTGQGC